MHNYFSKLNNNVFSSPTCGLVRSMLVFRVPLQLYMAFSEQAQKTETLLEDFST